MPSDFILPEDIERMAQQVSQDIADAWAMLNQACIIKQVPMAMAEVQVNRYMQAAQLSEIEAIRKVYNEIVYN